MGRSSNNYFSATRHPLPCFLFLLPLLAGYEMGVIWLGGTRPDELRNGADAWVRWLMEKLSLQDINWAPPALIAALFLVWSLFRFADVPKAILGTLTGMALESVAFALGLWFLGRALLPLLESANLLQIKTGQLDESMRQIVTFVGAGIYEEILFRLVLLTAIRFLFTILGAPEIACSIIAILGSAILFSLAHHIGPYGEEFERRVFIFRLMAGVYFAGLYQCRGFGISAGAHACYDVMVGVTVG
ncbi:MAG TPA: CPBP family intramembrane glutamic endopeptidase [Gemmataceae bacterium]|nr:CPBP family intramembrane glutamic endopeptidase [Gemmataceae bacterium]